MITTAGSDEKLAAAREDGADHVVNYRNENVTEAALDATGGRGVDVVIEHIGGEQFGACLAALRKGGRLVTCGGHAGEVVDFDIIPFFRNEWQVIGSRTGTTKRCQDCDGADRGRGSFTRVSTRRCRSRKRRRRTACSRSVSISARSS